MKDLTTNVEISNPMFGDDVEEDNFQCDLSQSFSLELDEKVSSYLIIKLLIINYRLICIL